MALDETKFHYIPDLEQHEPGTMIIDHFGRVYMMLSLNNGEHADLLINLTGAIVADPSDVACPWAYTTIQEVLL